jgi:site-specific DNA-methyltransferase (adenine-specific)
VCVPGCAVAELDKQSGTSRDGTAVRRNGVAQSILYGEGFGACAEGSNDLGYGDQGGASRFFPTFRYQAKPSTREKSNGLDARNHHPTCKPVELMRWLIRLVTPPGGVILDPFAGSGTTGVAATLEGFDCILIEAEAEYLPLIEGRVRWAEAQAEQPTLTFD